MAISITSSVIVLLMSIVVMMMVTSSYADEKITDSDIKHMCSKTDSHDECEKLAKSTLHATSRGSKELARAAVYLASQRAIRARGLFKTKSRETHDAKSKKVFDSCQKDYDGVVQATKSVYNALHSGAGNVSDAALKKAYQDAKNCHKLIDEAGGIGGSDMKKKTHEVELALSVAKVTVDHLNKKSV